MSSRIRKERSTYKHFDVDEVKSKVLPKVVNAVRDMGYELVGFEVKRGRTVSLEVEIYSRERGITLRDCEKVSSVVSRILDVDDPIPVRYNLLVSSPGADRVLKSEREYDIFAGREVEVKVNNFSSYNLAKEVNVGRLVGIEGDVVKFEIDGKEVWIDFSDVVYTKLYFDFGRYFGGRRV